MLASFSSAPENFTRCRKLPFDRLVLFISKLCKKTLSIELEHFFNELDCQFSCSVSAYAQQRLKLKPIFFGYWNKVLIESFFHYYGDNVKKWHGYRIVAADGSNVSLIDNPALNRYFGGQRNQTTSFVQAKTFYHYDILNKLITWSNIVNYRYGELQMAFDAINEIKEDAITIYDRHYSNYKTVALHMWQEKERKFVIRGVERMNIIKRFIESGKRSTIAALSPSPISIKTMQKSGFIVSSQTKLKVRLVRVDLGNTVEVLITNLWEEDGFESNVFKDLYFMRWGIETNISIQKNILQLESFSGLTVTSVLQDFYATVTMTNLHSLLIKDAQQIVDKESRRYKYPRKVNNNKSFGRLKINIVALFINNNIAQIIHTLHNYFIKDTLPIRKGRSYPRVRKNIQSRSKHKTYSNFKAAY